MNNPKVSIIMSTYKTKEEYLRESIESILSQSFHDFEFIIICDGSKMDLDIINDYQDSRIKTIIHEQNKGLPYSLNEAINISKGQYIARMDSDDIAFKNRIETQVKFMERHKNIDICSMFAKKIGKETHKEILPFVKDSLIKIQLLFSNCIIHPLVMIKKSFLIDNKLYYNEKFAYSQDYELWCRCAKVGKFAIIPKLGLYYRVHDKQISIDKKEAQFKLYKIVLNDNFKKFKNVNIDEVIKNISKLFEFSSTTNINEIIEISSFIDKLIDKNVIYSKKDFKEILYFYLFNKVRLSEIIKKEWKIILKNKRIRKQIFRFSNIKFSLKKICYRILCN